MKNCSLITASVLVLLASVPRRAPAQDLTPTIDRPASILFFPYLIADASRDTLIQITNTSNNPQSAQCFYLLQAASDLLPVLVQSHFQLFLRAQQPTHWILSKGREVDSSGPGCVAPSSDLDGAGCDPGAIAPQPNTRGEMVCIMTDDTGAPVAGNKLIGMVTVADSDGVASTQYRAIGVPGNPSAATGNPLLLDGQMYGKCPDTWVLNHLADGVDDPSAAIQTSVLTDFIVVPCRNDFAGVARPNLVVQLLIFNELDQRFSSSVALMTSLTWAPFNLSQRGLQLTKQVLGTRSLRTQMRALAQLGGSTGVAVVAEEVHTAGTGPQPVVTYATADVHHTAVSNGSGDTIVLPAQAVR